MTGAQIKTRLLLYVVIAMLTVAGTDLGSMEDATLIQWFVLGIQVTLAGAIAARAFLDGSNTMKNDENINRNL
jgi:hypothetical protein